VIDYYLTSVIILSLITGYSVVLYVVLRKNYLYFITVLEAVEAIAEETTEYIEIPYAELNIVSQQLNTIKTKLQKNARAAKEAEQKKNDLIVYLAHDLKTPLTSIIGYISLLKDEKEISKELQHRYVQIVYDKAERLGDLINEFFEITRFNFTKQILEIENVNITRLLEQLTYEFKPMFSEKNIICKVEVSKDLHIPCDVIKIQRVLDNLLRNAVNYSFYDSTIMIKVERINGVVEIHITNQGPTIPSEKLIHIFDQFYRGDNARRSTTGGAGLGLAIAKEIVELHEGSISAKSENECTSFTVILPEMS
jgi:two-component system, OmpR family, sensor histidine kinase VanS